MDASHRFKNHLSILRNWATGRSRKLRLKIVQSLPENCGVLCPPGTPNLPGAFFCAMMHSYRDAQRFRPRPQFLFGNHLLQSFVRLPRDFYDRQPAVVARELLGKLLIRRLGRQTLSGRIVETEAYQAKQDTACHAAHGRTPRNTAMFGPAGHTYVYSIHARYCFNVVTEQKDIPSAILIRALEPLQGIHRMKLLRRSEKLLNLTRGPARLCEALQIDKRLNEHDLIDSKQLWIAVDPSFDHTVHQITTSPRIGVTSAKTLELRFFFNGNRFVSGPRKFHRPAS